MSDDRDLLPLNTPAPDFHRIRALVVDSVRSLHSKRAYATALDEFFCWWQANGRPALTKAAVQQHELSGALAALREVAT